jgi:hypothetical protein
MEAQGEKMYSSYPFTTLALDGIEWSAWLLSRYPGKDPPVPTGQEAWWAPEPVWIQNLEEESYRLCRGSILDHPVVQSVAKHYIDRATLATNIDKTLYISDQDTRTWFQMYFSLWYSYLIFFYRKLIVEITAMIQRTLTLCYKLINKCSV